MHLCRVAGERQKVEKSFRRSSRPTTDGGGGLGAVVAEGEACRVSALGAHSGLLGVWFVGRASLLQYQPDFPVLRKHPDSGASVEPVVRQPEPAHRDQRRATCRLVAHWNLDLIFDVNPDIHTGYLAVTGGRANSSP